MSTVRVIQSDMKDCLKNTVASQRTKTVGRQPTYS